MGRSRDGAIERQARSAIWLRLWSYRAGRGHRRLQRKRNARAHQRSPTQTVRPMAAAKEHHAQLHGLDRTDPRSQSAEFGATARAAEFPTGPVRQTYAVRCNLQVLEDRDKDGCNEKNHNVDGDYSVRDLP